MLVSKNARRFCMLATRACEAFVSRCDSHAEHPNVAKILMEL